MRPRFLITGTLVGAIVMFVWQSIANAAIPWYQAQLHQFANDSAMVAAVRANAPTNGMYIANEGVLAIVAMKPGVTDMHTQMGPMLAKQLVLDIFAAFALCLLVLRLPAERPARTGVTFALGGAVVALVIVGSDAVWYGFPPMWATVSVVDQGISFFLAGLTLRAIARKTGGEMATARVTAERGVLAHGGLPSPGGTPART